MNANFRGKGASPTNDFGTIKVESLSYRMVKKIAEKFNRLSRVHQRHRQTDNRQTTDGRLIAYSDREREFTFAKNQITTETDTTSASFLTMLILTIESLQTLDISLCNSIYRSINILRTQIVTITCDNTITNDLLSL